MSSPLAVVTGTSSGIDYATTQALLQNGWRVLGIGRSAPNVTHSNYQHLTVDLTDTTQIATCITTIKEHHSEISALINNAGVGHFGPHETLSPESITQMVALNLLAPLLLIQGLLRNLRDNQGHILGISSFSAEESSSFGAAYAATKCGLSHFHDSLFEEVRKSGVRVTTITPDITRTPFYDNLTFAPNENELAAVTPNCVADAVLHALTTRTGTVTSKIILRPQRVLLDKRPR